MPLYVKNLLDVNGYDIPSTAAQRMDKQCPKSWNTLQNNYHTLDFKLKMVGMMLPDKLNNRNQQYIKK